MNQTILLRPHVEAELSAARASDLTTAWKHLERAHILSQPSARLHTRVHFAMLGLAVMNLDLREIFGQIVRVLVAGVGSLLGRYPLGNTGRARVPINAPMPIPRELQEILTEVVAS